MKFIGFVVKLGLVFALGWGGILVARHAFTQGMTTVIASESAPVKFDSPAIDTWDSDCFAGARNDRPINQNRCHAEAGWARDAARLPTPEPVMPQMSKDDSEHAVFWFGASMLAILLALGGVGAGLMWLTRG
jgi:hypothetical protein